MEPVAVEPAVEVAEPVESTPEAVTPAVELRVEDPPKRGRGRPPGAKNKPKVRVVPLEPEPPAEAPEAPEEAPETPEAQEAAPKKRVRAQPPQPKLLVVPQLPVATPHDTFRMAIAALGQVALADRASKQAHFDAMVSRMVK